MSRIRGEDGYLLVPRGLIFKTDIYIPLDATLKRSGTGIVKLPNFRPN